MTQLNLKINVEAEILRPTTITALIKNQNGGNESTMINYEPLLTLIAAEHPCERFCRALVLEILCSLRRSIGTDALNVNRRLKYYISMGEEKTVNIFYAKDQNEEAPGDITPQDLFTIILGKDGSNLEKPHEMIAKSFLDRVCQRSVGIDDAIDHPFLWSASEKIDYIKSVYCRFKLTKDEKKDGIKEKLTFTSDGSIEEAEYKRIDFHWVNKLQLDDDENAQTLNRMKKEKNAGSCNESLVKDLAKSYNPYSPTHLLRFFRNIHAHYHEQPPGVLCCFENNADGYYEFFLKRFPCLLSDLLNIDDCSSRTNVAEESKFLPPLKHS